ncbi:MAG TPA: hypothetical protein VMP01_27315 [Pirellulaceae bacterium]|nr:hypothetical protein [Pirellulaceae bacterium]
MVTILRTVGAIIAGIVLALGLVIAVELWSNVVHPLPPGFEHTPEAMCAHVERYPQWVLAIAAAAWGATTYASTWVASRLGNWVSGGLVGLLLLAAVLFNMSMLPYPVWFEAANVIVFPLAILLGLRGARRRQAEQSAATYLGA